MVPVAPAGIPTPPHDFLPISALPTLQPAREVILHALFSVSFKKTEVTNGQATSVPQANFAWPMPKIE